MVNFRVCSLEYLSNRLLVIVTFVALRIISVVDGCISVNILSCVILLLRRLSLLICRITRTVKIANSDIV